MMMKISTHKYSPKLLKDGSLDKQDAMFQSVGGFESKQVFSIQSLAKLVRKNGIHQTPLDI